MFGTLVLAIAAFAGYLICTVVVVRFWVIFAAMGFTLFMVSGFYATMFYAYLTDAPGLDYVAFSHSISWFIVIAYVVVALVSMRMLLGLPPVDIHD
jgi:hypothetical protein